MSWDLRVAAGLLGPVSGQAVPALIIPASLITLSSFCVWGEFSSWSPSSHLSLPHLSHEHGCYQYAVGSLGCFKMCAVMGTTIPLSQAANP